MLWKVSRFSLLHNSLRIIYNNIAYHLPNGLKYGIGKKMRAVRLPYKLIRNGWVIVQLGCPWDIMLAGRSRGIYFSLFAGKQGKVVIVEPDPANLKKLYAFIKKENLENIIVVEKGVWSKKTTLRFLSDPNHPASNIIEEVYDTHVKKKKREGFNSFEITVDTLDNILAALDMTSVDLISITTNGSEEEILTGMHNTLSKTRYLSIINSDNDYLILKEFGFSKIGGDDRGHTYSREDA